MARNIQLEDPSGDLVDYKFMCFNGKAKFIEVYSNRFSESGLEETIYDMSWNKTCISKGSMSPSNKFQPKPKTFDKMLELSEFIAKDFSHVRVDWYSICDKIFFGELTFFDDAGLVPFNKSEYDELIGGYLVLPPKYI